MIKTDLILNLTVLSLENIHVTYLMVKYIFKYILHTLHACTYLHTYLMVKYWTQNWFTVIQYCINS